MSVEIKNVVKAMARVTWTGAAIVFSGRNPGFSAIVRNNVGVYTLTLDEPFDVNNMVITLTMLSATDSVGYINPVNPGNFTVNIVDMGNNPLDSSFTIIVHEVPNMA